MMKIINEIKNSLKKIKEGFTLVELLGVIVVLAIIMLIAIPAVLNVMTTAKRKSFAEYVDKVSSLSQKQLSEDQMMGNKNGGTCYIYNVKSELGLNNTGDYEGWVLINPVDNDIYVTLFDKDFVIIGYHYSDSSLNMNDYIEKRSSSNEDKLTIDELCNLSSCSTCTMGDTNLSNINNKTKTYLVDGSTFQSRLLQLMCPGAKWSSDCTKKFTVVSDNSDVPASAILLSVDDSEHKMYAWVDQDNSKLYIYTDADKYAMNSDSSYMFSGLSILGFDYSKLDFSNVTNLNRAFGGRRFSENIDLSNADVSKVTSMEGTFSSSTFSSLNLNNWKALSINNMLYLFQTSNIDTLKMDNTKFVISPSDSASGMKSAFYELVVNNGSLDLNNWDISKVTSLEETFYRATIPNLNISNWDVSNVVNMHETFGYINTNELILNNWNTSKVTIAWNLFQYSTINKIDLSNWDLSHLKDGKNYYYAYQLFYRSTVSDLILKNLDLSNCEELTGFIYECDNLKTIDLSSVNISGVKVVSKFIHNCDKLETADIRNMDFSSVTSSSNFFKGNPKLTTIYANENTKISSSMVSNYSLFNGGLDSLVGGNGLKYESSKSSGAYANYENGYFTYKA
ncbi:MAG: BspA family leucine-rich repeat surface protein [Bacilli bacterium]|nr:BspA family leucine-rich repeat surface protein [Bacilli bacterium]